MQIRTVVTWTPEEEEMVNNSYADYLREGGKLNKNRWLKEVIMKQIRR